MATGTLTSTATHRTLTAEVTAEIPKFDAMSGDASQFYYELRPQLYPTFIDGEGIQLPFADLTIQQKVDVLVTEMQYHWIEGARAQYKNNKIAIAKSEAETTLEDRY